MLARIRPTNEPKQNHAADVLVNFSVANVDGPLAAFGDRRIVRHDQHRGAQALMQIVNQLQNFLAGSACPDCRWVHRPAAREDTRSSARAMAHALPFAAGKFIGKVIQARAELHQRQQFARAGVDFLLARQPRRCRGKRHFRGTSASAAD